MPQAQMMPDDGPKAYVEFEQRAIEDRDASIAAGHYVAKDIEYAKITPPGGNLVVEREVDAELRERYAPQYDAWKKGLESPIEGSSLRDWPPASPAWIATLSAMHVYTVEDLARLSEPGIQRLGIGARAMQQKARTWLDAADSQGKVAEEVAALTAKMDDVTAELDRLREENESLKAQVGQPKRGPGRPRKDENRE